MAAPTFYNKGDQAIYNSGMSFVPQEKYRLGYTAPTVEEQKIEQTFGIPATNAFTNSGGGGGSGGNAFGYGTAIKPGDPSVLTSGPYQGQSGYYDSLNYSGGLPGNISQKGPGRHFEYDNTGSFYKDYSLTPRKEVPGVFRAAAPFVPFGNFALNKIENKMNPQGPFTKDDNPYGGTYGVAGLSNEQKGVYDQLAASNMLFEGPGGLKTLTGKNFTGKGYIEGQIENAYGFGFDTMTDQEIEDDLEAASKNKKKQFEYKQKIEALKVLRHRQKEFEKPGGTKDQVGQIQGRVNERENEINKATEDGRSVDPNEGIGSVNPNSEYGKKEGYSGGTHNPHTQTGWSGSSKSSGSTSKGKGRDEDDKMATGGRVGYFFGGKVNFKNGGLASIL